MGGGRFAGELAALQGVQGKKTLFFDLSGHGHFDMAACDKYFSRELADYIDPEEALKASLANLPKVAAQLLQ